MAFYKNVEELQVLVPWIAHLFVSIFLYNMFFLLLTHPLVHFAKADAMQLHGGQFRNAERSGF